MESLANALVLLAVFGFLASLVGLVVALVRRKKKKPWILGFVAFLVLFVVVGETMLSRPDTGKETPKKVATTEKKQAKPSTQKKKEVQPVPKKKVSTKTAYTDRQVYQSVMDYQVHGPGYTVAALTDTLVAVMQAQGDAVDVVEGQAKHRSGDIWEVSYVVVVNYTERHKFIYHADMNNSVVKPINKAARDLWGK